MKTPFQNRIDNIYVIVPSFRYGLISLEVILNQTGVKLPLKSIISKTADLRGRQNINVIIPPVIVRVLDHLGPSSKKDYEETIAYTKDMIMLNKINAIDVNDIPLIINKDD